MGHSQGETPAQQIYRALVVTAGGCAILIIVMQLVLIVLGLFILLMIVNKFLGGTPF